jgi:hypothetical protein
MILQEIIKQLQTARTVWAGAMPDDPRPLRMVPVIPDSALQAELRFICGWKP